ncbi:hypothetical protein Tco_0783256 [Tanacetum coccineum]
MATKTKFSTSIPQRQQCYFSGEDRRRRKWRKLMKKVVEESKKSIYGSSTKALVFRYDAIKMDTLADFNCTTTEGRSSNFSECSTLSSVSDHDIEFTQTDNGRSTSRKWKKLMKKLIQRSKKSLYGSSERVVYGYDAVSYSLNFDDGNHSDEYYLYGFRCSQAL